MSPGHWHGDGAAAIAAKRKVKQPSTHYGEKFTLYLTHSFLAICLPIPPLLSVLNLDQLMLSPYSLKLFVIQVIALDDLSVDVNSKTMVGGTEHRNAIFLWSNGGACVAYNNGDDDSIINNSRGSGGSSHSCKLFSSICFSWRVVALMAIVVYVRRFDVFVIAQW